MEESGEVRSDLRLPHDPDLAKEIQERFDRDEQVLVTVLKAVDDEQAIAVKNMPK